MEGCFRSGGAQFLPEKQGKAGGDHFIVEELLDFSNEEDRGAEVAAEEDGRSEETGGNCSADCCANSSSGGGSDNRFSDEFVCRSLADVGFLGDLCEPVIFFLFIYFPARSRSETFLSPLAQVVFIFNLLLSFFWNKICLNFKNVAIIKTAPSVCYSRRFHI